MCDGVGNVRGSEAVEDETRKPILLKNLFVLGLQCHWRFPAVRVSWPALALFAGSGLQQGARKDTGCSVTGEPGNGRRLYRMCRGLTFPGAFPVPCQATAPRGPVVWWILVVAVKVPLSSALELFGFTRGVIGVAWVFTFRHILVLDFSGLLPSGIVEFLALNHPACFGGRVPVFSALSVFLVIMTPRLFGVFSVVISRATSRGWSSVGLSFLLLVLVEGRI